LDDLLKLFWHEGGGIFADEFSERRWEPRIGKRFAHGRLQNLHSIARCVWRKNDGRAAKPNRALQRQHLPLSFRLSERFEFRQMSKTRMTVSFGRFKDCVKIDQPFINPLRCSLHDGSDQTRSGIDFAAQKSQVNLRSGISNNELGISETEKEREEPAGDVDIVPYGLSADSYPRGSAEFLEVSQPNFLSGGQNVLRRGIGRAEINKLVDVVENSGLSLDRPRLEAPATFAAIVCPRPAAAGAG
jgi:hypothetical protein